MKASYLYLTLWLSFTSLFAGAQNTVLAGMIKDSANGKPLAGVSIFLGYLWLIEASTNRSCP